VSFVKDIKHSLLLERNLSQAKLDCQRIFVWFLEEPMTKRVENLNRGADNLKNFFFGQKLSAIRVHSWLIMKILTKHPLGKSGKNIDKQKYETLKKAILSALRSKELTHTELFKQLNKNLNKKFSGNISWYGETVKLDLEARKIIERTSSKPQKYRLKPR
jgi:hypothetical protein